MASFTSDVILLCLTRDGAWAGGGTGPSEAAGAAAVADAVLSGALRLEEGRLVTVEASRVPAALAAVLERTTDPGAVVGELGEDALRAGLEELEARGDLTVQRSRFLGMLPTVRITVLDDARRSALLAELTALVEGEPAGERGVLAFAILDAARILPFVRAVSEERRVEILRGAIDAGGLAEGAARSVEQLRVAVYTSVFAAGPLR
ncbi:Golgi phosphoprotein 3 GPP34 [Rathayibacter sp. PhB152]|uniref:GPP34 family phosphoprotein n=1 Tax=unclassified Rathayibacter TaxID=2609250 RepID=UPI000FB1822D|nr:MULTISPECIES: GPP34 family phosphoprotein [unclassified Rathayibacter]ROQ56085.1 Golgi phosphoprotein 3 GPP34 [Rathayibacter sp. PhB152]ROS25415.1 Golgi phosphoprotein 3 GPP34 [Rathayibacter sp. PhB127]